MKLPLPEKILLFACLILGILLYAGQLAEARTEEMLVEKTATDQLMTREAFQKIVTDSVAQSVVVFDLKKNELVAGKAMDAEMSLASITKIFTSAFAYETFLKNHARDSSEARAFLDRIQLMLAQSSNEEAEAIGQIFGATHQEAARNLTTHNQQYSLVFKNLSGLDIKETFEVGGKGLATDIARGIRDVYFKYPELFDKTILPYGDNTNVIAGQLDFFLAGKTGFTDFSGGNLAVIIQKGITHKYLVLVLGSTENDRFVDVEHIVKALLQLNI